MRLWRVSLEMEAVDVVFASSEEEVFEVLELYKESMLENAFSATQVVPLLPGDRVHGYRDDTLVYHKGAEELTLRQARMREEFFERQLELFA